MREFIISKLIETENGTEVAKTGRQGNVGLFNGDSFCVE